MEEMSCACWDFVLELRRGRHSLGHSREAVVEMVHAMLMWGSPALAFVRKVCHQSFLGPEVACKIDTATKQSEV